MKIYDCFSFFNELDLLEFRLEVCYQYVDKFILVEAENTHSNLPKPLYFQENKQRFIKYLDKIIHIVVPKEEFVDKVTNYWYNEEHQRNCINRGILNDSSDIFCLISDLDEIPNYEEIIKSKYSDNTKYLLSQDIFYYYANLKLNIEWQQSFLMKADLLKQYNISDIFRNRNNNIQIEVIKNAGYHFSYLFGKDFEKYNLKLEAFLHNELNTDFYKSEMKEAVENNLDFLKSHHDRQGMELEKVDFDEYFPEFIKNKKQYFNERNLIL